MLADAAAGGWSVHTTRDAARDASLEGRIAAQGREIADLKNKLKAARTDPRDSAEQARRRLTASGRTIRDEAARAAALAEKLAGDDALDGLHGNARRALARDVRRFADRMARDVNLAIDRTAAAADRIEGAPEP